VTEEAEVLPLPTFEDVKQHYVREGRRRCRRERTDREGQSRSSPHQTRRFKSIAWRADGCPMHRIDGSVKYSCKHQAVVRKAKNEN
jgi:hypothetical protein